MTTQTQSSPHLLAWFAGIAVILFSAAGIAAIMGWIPTSMGRSADNAELVQLPANTAKPAAAKAHTPAPARSAPVQVASSPQASNTPSKAICLDCGVIESTRETSHKGEGSGLGAVGGAVVGGLIGNQVK